MTLPSTRSAAERGLAEQAEGNQHEAGQRRQLELDQRHKELDRQDEEGEQHHDPGEQQHHDLNEIFEEADVAHQPGDRIQNRPAGVDPDLRDAAGAQEVGGRHDWSRTAFRPSPEKLSKMMRARLFQLPMR